MDWLKDLFTEDSVAHAVLVLGLVAVCGLGLGSVQIKGIGLGIAGVLFAGLAFGHFGLTISHEVLDFAREFGLILFVYAIGVQVGPGFFSSLRRQGLALNALALSIVICGVLVTLAVSRFGGVPMPVAAGLFSGGTTNTPSLAAAQQALQELPGASENVQKMPGLGYAVAYPFGVLGIILTMLMARRAFRVDMAREVEESLPQNETAPLETLNIGVTNENLNGLPIRKLPRLKDSGVVVSRVQHDGEILVARGDTRIESGDVLLAVGTKEELEAFRLIVGEKSSLDLRQALGEVTTRSLIVTQRAILGKSIHQLNWAGRFGVVVTRINRAGVELTPRSNLYLQFGDRLLAVGSAEALTEAAREIGDSAKELEHPSMAAIFLGIAFGVLLGSFPIALPGFPAPVKLGLAGGPLLAAILLSRVGRIGPLVWHMPPAAGAALRETGIILFLACVGLKSGGNFVPTLLQGDGWHWMALATLITITPLVLAAFVARFALKMPFPALCGLLAGSMTDPPALAFAHSVTDSDAPAVTYATVYPLVMIARIVAAQVLVIFFR